jgi:hypothetical protein
LQTSHDFFAETMRIGIITAISLSQGKESPPDNFPSSTNPSPTVYGLRTS